MAILAVVEGILQRLDGFVTIFEQERTYRIDGKATECQNPVSPTHAQALDNGACGKVVRQPAQACTGRRNAHSEAATTREPLRERSRRRNVRESQSPSETDTL